MKIATADQTCWWTNNKWWTDLTHAHLLVLLC